MDKEQLQAHRRERLEALAEALGGYAALGRTLGHRDGAYISQMCKGKRGITETLVAQCEALQGYAGWFHRHEASPELFTPELVIHLKQMEGSDRKRMENMLRSALNLPLLR